MYPCILRGCGAAGHQIYSSKQSSLEHTSLIFQLNNGYLFDDSYLKLRDGAEGECLQLCSPLASMDLW